MEQQPKRKAPGTAKKNDTRRCCNLKFSPAYWAVLEELKKQCGFRSTYGMLITIIQCFVRYVAKRREQITREDQHGKDMTREIEDMTREIEEMFADLEDSEPTPANTARSVTRHKPSERRLYGREDDGSTQDKRRGS